MKHKNKARSSSLFLMELILAILFFSVASAVCVQIFVKSHMMSKDSSALNHAVNECTSMAEVLDTADSIPEGIALLKTLYPDGSFPEQGTETGTNDAAELFFYYDSRFEPCTEEAHNYTLSLHLSQEDDTLTARMDVTEASGESIYRLETKYHIARRKSDETR